MTAADREPTASIDWLELGDNEEVHWVDGPRLQSVYPVVAVAVVGVVAIIAAVVLTVVSPWWLLGSVALAALPCWRYARITNTAYLLTNRRIAVKTGVLGVSVRVVTIDRIQNTQVKQDSIGRLVGYGQVIIETAGGSGLVFGNIDTPTTVRSTIDARRDRTTAETIPGTREQWVGVLREVRAWRRAIDGN